jgi:hypothetical protein
MDPLATRQGADFMHPRFGTGHGPWEVKASGRPGDMVRFYRCCNVLIQDVTLANSTSWTLHLHDCESVNILGLRIHSQGSDRRTPNDDGIDLRFCRRGIANCDIDTGDDCIAVFGSQMVVSNGTLSSRSAGVRWGMIWARSAPHFWQPGDRPNRASTSTRSSTTIENLRSTISSCARADHRAVVGKGEPSTFPLPA